MVIPINMIQTVAVAVIVFLVGNYIVKKVHFFERYCIPAPVVGGLLFSLIHLIGVQTNTFSFEFDPAMNDFFMIGFFSTIGFSASWKVIKQGGIAETVRKILLDHLFTDNRRNIRMNLRSGSAGNKKRRAGARRKMPDMHDRQRPRTKIFQQCFCPKARFEASDQRICPALEIVVLDVYDYKSLFRFSHRSYFSVIFYSIFSRERDA